MTSGGDTSDAENLHEPLMNTAAYTDDDSAHDDYYGQLDDYEDNLDYAADAVRVLHDFTNNNSDAAVDTDTDVRRAANAADETRGESKQQQPPAKVPPRSATTTIHRRELRQFETGRKAKPVDNTNKPSTHAAVSAVDAAEQKRSNVRSTRLRVGRWTMPGAKISSFASKSNDAYQTTDEEANNNNDLSSNQTHSKTAHSSKRVNFDADAAGDSDDSAAARGAKSRTDNHLSFASGTEDDDDDMRYGDDVEQAGGKNSNRLPHLWPPAQTATKSLNSSTLPTKSTVTKGQNGEAAKTNATLLDNFNTDLGLKLPGSNTHSTSLPSPSHHSSVVQKFLSSTKLSSTVQQHMSDSVGLDDLPACARCELLDKIHEQTVETLQQQVRELKDKNGRLTQLVDEQTYRLDKLEKEKQKFEESQQDVLLGIGGGGGSGSASASSNSQELLNIKAMELSRKNRELTARLESVKSKYEAALKKVEALEHQLGEEADEKTKRQKASQDPDALQRLQDDCKSLEQKYTAAKEKAALTLNAQQMLKAQVNKLTALLRRELGPECDFRSLMQTHTATSEDPPHGWQGREEQIRILKAKVEQQRKHIEELAHQKFGLLQHAHSTHSRDVFGSESAVDDNATSLAPADSGHRTSGSLLSVGADARNRRHVKELDKERRAQQEKSIADLNELRSKSDDYKRKWQNEKSRNEYLQQQNQLLVQTNKQLTQAFEKDEKIIQQLNDDLQTTKKRARQLQRDESEMLWKMQRRIEQIERQTQLDMMQQQQQAQPAPAETNNKGPPAHSQQESPSQQPLLESAHPAWDAEFAGLKRQINEFVELAVPLKKLYSDLVTTTTASGSQSKNGSPLGSSTNILNNHTATAQQQQNIVSRSTDALQCKPGTSNAVEHVQPLQQRNAQAQRPSDRGNSLLEELTFVRDENAQLSRSLKDVLERLQQQQQNPAALTLNSSGGGDIPVQAAVTTSYAESVAASSVHSGKISRVHRIHGLTNTNKWAGVKSKLPAVAIVSKNRQQPATAADTAGHSNQ